METYRAPSPISRADQVDERIDAAVLAGQAVYTKINLAFYDFVVLRVFMPFVWKCPTAALLNLYASNVSPNHLDCGVGTAFLLDRTLTSSSSRIVLVDLNPNSLSKAARRLRRYRPAVYRRNVLAPLAIDEAPFDSIGMNALLHCLPGDIHAKSVVFDHAAAYLKPGGCVFGATLLAGGVPHGAAAKRMMAFFNRRRIFSNLNDTLDGLTRELEARFDQVEIDVMGCVALFRAR
jgi:SAM-dependent methyltransferase